MRSVKWLLALALVALVATVATAEDQAAAADTSAPIESDAICTGIPSNFARWIATGARLNEGSTFPVGRPR